jgi:hypothetical protein
MREPFWRAIAAVLYGRRLRDRRLEFLLGTIAVLVGAAILFVAVLPAYWD